METKQTEWKTLADIKTFRTSNPKEMLDKWLAESMTKKWTEDYVDQDTGEIVSMERSDTIMPKGIHVNREKVSEIMFAIQAGDVEDVCMTDFPSQAERYDYRNLVPFEVTIATGAGKKMYLTRATSVEAAIECIENYAPLYLNLNAGYWIDSVKKQPYRIVEDDDVSILQSQNEEEDKDSEYEYYKVTGRLNLYDSFEDKMVKTNITIIIKAHDVSEAKERSQTWLTNEYKEELNMNKWNDAKIIKANPYITEGVVPVSYCELFMTR